MLRGQAAAGALWVAVGCGSAASVTSPVPAPAASRARPEPAAVVPAPVPDVPPTPPRARIPPGARIVAPNVAPARRAFAARPDQHGSLWIAPLSGNGGRDVVLYIPPDPNPEATVQLVYHFHGTYGERMEEPRSGVPKKAWVGWDRLAQTMEAMDELQTQGDRTVVLVYPISAGKRLEPGHRGWSNVAYDRYWMRPANAPGYVDDFGVLHAEVLEHLEDALGVPRALVEESVMVEGHSAGGLALRNVAENTGGVSVDEYIFLDASFMSWADGCHRAVRASKSGARLTLVITDRGIADPFGKRDPWCVTTPQLAARYEALGPRCDDDPESTPPGESLTCEQMAELAADWVSDYKQWCADLANDMVEVSDVYVHRTKVPHGKQPRRFSGGLELPADRFQRR